MAVHNMDLEEAMERMGDMSITAHVHDKVIIEAVMDDSIEAVCRVMAVVPD